MGFQIKVSKEAEKDLLKAECHYKFLGQENTFNDDFVTQLKYLKANPYLFQIYYKNVRVIHLKQFKYSIHYIIENDIVYILRLLHQNEEF